MRRIHVRIVLIRRGLVGTSFRGGFVCAHAELPYNFSRNSNIWAFLEIDVAQSVSLRMTVWVMIAGHEKGIFEISARRVKDPECSSAVFNVALTNPASAPVGAQSLRHDSSIVVSS